MEPWFSPRLSTPQSTKTEFVIGGLRVYVYGLEEVTQKEYTDVAVLYIAHGRTQNHADVEAFSNEILHQYRRDTSQKRAGLISVALDLRNHGGRKINDKANETWDDGNEYHAQDMMASIVGSCQDFELVMTYLPTYLTQFVRFYNIMSGISLGGHTCWRLATSITTLKGNLHSLAIMISCPNQTSLLLSRMGIDFSSLSLPPEDVYKIPYDELSKSLTETQRRRWPRRLCELVSEMDRLSDEKFPRHIPTYILNGNLDNLVPDQYTKPWVARRSAEGYDNIVYYVQENTGHSCTDQMVDNIATWLLTLFSGEPA